MYMQSKISEKESIPVLLWRSYGLFIFLIDTYFNNSYIIFTGKHF